MIQNKIIARYQNGRVLKGVTGDFLQTKETFHLTPVDEPGDGKPILVQVPDLKAIFFVKNFAGRPQPYTRGQQFEPGKPLVGRKIRVVFNDGEILVGTTQGYDPQRQGFFILPADTETNNERCFVIKKATKEVTLL